MEIFRETRPDGAQWRHFDTEASHIIITASGREFLRHNPSAFRRLRVYNKIVASKKSSQEILVGNPNSVRSYLASGGNSDVYRSGEKVVVKEALNTQSLLSALQRMDVLHNVIEKGFVPRWIRVPEHYGLVIPKEGDRQYMPMQKVDHGLTVEQVLSGEGFSSKQQQQAVERFRSRMVPGEEGVILDQYQFLTDSVKRALCGQDLDPAEYMPDWHMGNVLVERNPVPIGDSRYTFWMIDQ